ncbi:MAG: site-specific DNA-methyltransferase [Dehalococcoidales bacterium]|nr:site-specific DNA-methyltransferase [Dehalococcoidales bacterium]
MKLICGDCLLELAKLPANSVDAIITDPPYGLGDVKDIGALLKSWMAGESGDEAVGKGGFMGQEWDRAVPPPRIWKECIRVLKPGGHMLVFAGTRTQDLMGISIRIAGFELRDEISYYGAFNWINGSGFPKGLNISKAIDQVAGAEREVVGYRVEADDNRSVEQRFRLTAPSTEEAKRWEGWQSGLKPAHEPILMFRKPLDGTIIQNVLKYGTGGINIDGCRISTSSDTRINAKGGENGLQGSSTFRIRERRAEEQAIPKGRYPSNVILSHHQGCVETAGNWECHSECPVGQMPFSASGDLSALQRKAENRIYGKKPNNAQGEWKKNSGSAARFFYCAKASVADREDGLEAEEGKSGNTHMTVKPTDLMRYLCRMVVPPGGVVLDPFMGSGSTGKGAVLEGVDFIGIEKEERYVEIARARIEFAQKLADEIPAQPVAVEIPKYEKMTKERMNMLRKKIKNENQLGLFDAIDKAEIGG